MLKRRQSPFTTEQALFKLQKATEKAPPEVKAGLDIKLSTYHAHSRSLHSSNKPTHYFRSAKHPLNSKEDTIEKDSPELKRYRSVLANGNRAHVGLYSNNFERVGDRPFGPENPKASTTTPGNALLYNTLLIRRQNICKLIASALTDLTHLKVRFLKAYPCLMIHIEKSTVVTTYKKPTAASLEAWSYFLLCYLQGALNALAVERNIPIEAINRSSFGFLSPTLAPTGEAIRLNPGIIPAVYQNLIIDTLRAMDDTLGRLHTNLAERLPIPEDSFYFTDEFADYRDRKENNELENLVELLWEPVDSSNKTAIFNIMRSDHASLGIAKHAFEALKAHHGDHDEAMIDAIQWVTSQLTITPAPKTSKNDYKLTFSQKSSVDYTIRFSRFDPVDTWNDKPFWDCIYTIYASLSSLQTKHQVLEDALDVLYKAYKDGNLYCLTPKLEYVQSATLIQASKLSRRLDPEDGYGSDSEEEADIDDTKIYARKIITSNGMRAIIGAIMNASLGENKFHLFTENPYYEVKPAVKILEDMKDVDIIQEKTLDNASIYYADATPCVTTHQPQAGELQFDEDAEMLEKFRGKNLIIDTTSATTNKMHAYIRAFAKSRASFLYFVSSGHKNEQFGSDNNSYGTIRLFSKSKKELMDRYNRLLENEAPVLSSISHQTRRLCKKAGATPTNATILKKR